MSENKVEVFPSYERQELNSLLYPPGMEERFQSALQFEYRRLLMYLGFMAIMGEDFTTHEAQGVIEKAKKLFTLCKVFGVEPHVR